MTNEIIGKNGEETLYHAQRFLKKSGIKEAEILQGIGAYQDENSSLIGFSLPEIMGPLPKYDDIRFNVKGNILNIVYQRHVISNPGHIDADRSLLKTLSKICDEDLKYSLSGNSSIGRILISSSTGFLNSEIREQARFYGGVESLIKNSILKGINS